jgi:hypothetical protein
MLGAQKVEWFKFLKFGILITFFAALFSTFAFASFMDLIALGYIILIMFTTIEQNYTGYLSQFFSLLVILVTYDIFWLLFASTVKISINIDWNNL